MLEKTHAKHVFSLKVGDTEVSFGYENHQLFGLIEANGNGDGLLLEALMQMKPLLIWSLFNAGGVPLALTAEATQYVEIFAKFQAGVMLTSEEFAIAMGLGFGQRSRCQNWSLFCNTGAFMAWSYGWDWC